MFERSKLTPTADEKLEFKNFFSISSEHWMEDKAIDVHSVLSSMYSAYYTGKNPNYVKLKTGIINNVSKAKELFKSLFRIPTELNNQGSRLASSPVLKEISQHYGEHIVAHGVEAMKGGMYNLLLMAISNRINVPSTNWGYFQEGMPNISPLCHGPYFIIYTIDKENPLWPALPTIEQIEYILLPFSENIDILKTSSANLLTHRLIDQDQHDLFCSKLIDYESFLSLLKIKHNFDTGNIPARRSP